MAARSRLWQLAAGQCEDKIACALSDRDDLRRAICAIEGFIRRGDGDPTNAKLILNVLERALPYVESELVALRAERAELDGQT